VQAPRPHFNSGTRASSTGVRVRVLWTQAIAQHAASIISMARDRNGSKVLIPHGFTACFWAGIGHDRLCSKFTICAGRGFGTSWEQQQVGCAGLTHAQRVPSSRCPELVHIHLGPWRPRKRCPSQAPHHSSLKNANCAESYSNPLFFLFDGFIRVYFTSSRSQVGLRHVRTEATACTASKCLRSDV